MNTSSFALYRQTTIGLALQSALEDMVEYKEVSQSLEAKMLTSFDKVICKQFADVIEDPTCYLTARSANYNHCDDVWCFTVVLCKIEG